MQNQTIKPTVQLPQTGTFMPPLINTELTVATVPDLTATNETESINVSEISKPLNFQQFQNQMIANQALDDFTTQQTKIYNYLGKTITPYDHIDICVQLAIGASETVLSFIGKNGAQKMNQVVMCVMGYLVFCGQVPSKNEAMLIKHMCQMVYDKNTIKGCLQTFKQIGTEIESQVKGCLGFSKKQTTAK